MRKIKEVLRLHHEAGLTQRQIGRSLGLSHNSAGKYLEAAEAADLTWPVPEWMDEDDIRDLLFPGAGPKKIPSKPLPDMNWLHKELRRKHVTLRLLWEEYRKEHGEQGYGFTQFASYYNRWREKVEVTMRQRHVAGEATFVDWAGATMPWFDLEAEKERRAYVFVAVLGASDYTFCRAYPSTALSCWIEAHMAAFRFFGGCTSILVPDNAKTAVTAACYYEPELHPTYGELAEHYRTAVLPTRVGAPRDKAKAEAAVLHVERRVLAPLRNHRFFSVAEINDAIEPLLRELNEKPFQKMEGSRRSWFEELDRPALTPLPSQPFEMAVWRKAVANLDYHVQADWHFYSVPYTLAKQKVDVRLGTRTVAIFHKGRRVALHPRSWVRGAATTDPAHQPKAHKRHKGWTPGTLIQRAGAVGPSCAHVVSAVLEERPHPEQGYRAAIGILRLGRDYGGERLEAACKRAKALECASYGSIRSMLRSGLDRQALTEEAPPIVSDHPNIRGGTYYQPSRPTESAR